MRNSNIAPAVSAGYPAGADFERQEKAMPYEHNTSMSRRKLLKAAALSGAVVAVMPVSLFAKERPAGYKLIDLSTKYKVDPAWPGRPGDAEWGDMSGVAVDAKDQVYLFTRANPPIQVYQADGKFVRSWGKEHVVTAHYIRFGPDGNVWLADNGKHVVMQFTPEGKLLRTLGTPGKLGCDQTHLNQPTDMIATKAGDVFITDGYGNSRVAHFDAKGKFVKAWGKFGEAPGQFNLPHGIVMDSKGKLYIADRNNGRVQVFDQEGKFLAQWAGLMVPWGLWINDKDEIWACGSSHMPKKGKWRGLPPKDQILLKFNTSGKVLEAWSAPVMIKGVKPLPGQVNWLHAIALDSKGNIYLGDIKGRRAQKYLARA
jgi:DNA-binding beta-propeller fold protein YncE